MFQPLFLSESQFHSYYKPQVVLAPDSDPPLAASGLESVKYGNSWMRKTLQTRQACDCSTGNPHEELCIYLDGPLETVKNVVAWWGVHGIVLFGSIVLTHFIIVATFCPIPDTFSHGP